MRTRKQVRFIGTQERAQAFLRYPDGTIGTARRENEVRRMECRPLLVEQVKVQKEARHGK